MPLDEPAIIFDSFVSLFRYLRYCRDRVEEWQGYSPAARTNLSGTMAVLRTLLDVETMGPANARKFLEDVWVPLVRSLKLETKEMERSRAADIRTAGHKIDQLKKGLILVDATDPLPLARIAKFWLLKVETGFGYEVGPPKGMTNADTLRDLRRLVTNEPGLKMGVELKPTTSLVAIIPGIGLCQ